MNHSHQKAIVRRDITIKQSMESGYESDCSVWSLTSLSHSPSGVNKNVDNTIPSHTISIFTSPNSVNNHVQFDNFLQFCSWLVKYKPNWHSWTPNSDIRANLSSQLLEEGRSLLWDSDISQGGDFQALSAARDGDENVVALAVLIAQNHKVLNTKNALHQTLLHITSKFGSAKLNRLIITRGADGSIPDVWGDTPLHIAATMGPAYVITAITLPLTKLEVKHPYYKCPYKSLPQDNVNSLNHDGRAPIHLAAEVADSLPHREAIAALHLYAKCNMDYRRLGDGYAASHIAIDNGDIDCLHVCLEAKADSEVRNFKGETPQQLAFLCHRSDMVRMCQAFGAGPYQLKYAHTEPVIADDSDDEANRNSIDNREKRLAVLIKNCHITH